VDVIGTRLEVREYREREREIYQKETIHVFGLIANGDNNDELILAEKGI
jgi:hypothetical protein